MNRRELMLGGAAMVVATTGVAQALAAVVPERKFLEIDLKKFYSDRDLRSITFKTTSIDGESTCYEKMIFSWKDEASIKSPLERWLQIISENVSDKNGSSPKYRTIGYEIRNLMDGSMEFNFTQVAEA